MASRQNPLLLSILGGVLSASPYFLASSPTLWGMLLTYFSTLPLFAVGLSLGLNAAIIAAGVGVGCSFLAALMMGSFGLLLPYILFNILPTLLILFQVLKAYADEAGEIHVLPAEYITRFLTWMAVGIVAIACILLRMMSENPSSLIETALGQQPPETLMLLSHLIKILPGLVGASWLMMILSNAILAQGLLKAFNQNLRPSPDIADVYPFPVFYYLLAGAGVCSILPLGWISTVTSNLLFPLMIPFLLTGLGTIHVIARKSPYRSWILGGFYALAFVLSWPFLFLIMVGIIEPWVKLRNRVN